MDDASSGSSTELLDPPTVGPRDLAHDSSTEAHPRREAGVRIALRRREDPQER